MINQWFSSQDVVHELQLLKSHAITHIVNAATGISNNFPKHFIYYTISVLDCPTQNLRKYFDGTLKFMRSAIDDGGRVLIHCNAGISRSSTFVIAFIMRYEGKSLDEAYAQVKAVRSGERLSISLTANQRLVSVACPNFGFMQQLREYEAEIKIQFNCLS